MLLCVVSVLFYRHIALTNRILVGGDAFAYFYPYRAYAADAVRSGQVPLWNPYLFMGVPFVANPQSAVFYPLNLALCWLSAPKLLAWSIVIHTWLAAAFSYLYARHTLRLSPGPAFLGACVFAFGGFLSGQAEHINQLNVSAWFPLLLLLWDLCLRERRRWLAVAALGLAVGVGLLAGHTQASYISLAGLGVYALLPALPPLWGLIGGFIWPGRQREARSLLGYAQGAAQKHALRPDGEQTARCKHALRPGPGRLKPGLQGGKALGAAIRSAVSPMLGTLLQLGLICVLAVGIAAIQIAPTLELARSSIRRGGLDYREAVAFSLSPLPRLLRYTFLPPWGANLADVFGGSYFTEYLAYVGVLPLALVGVWGLGGLWRAARRVRGGGLKSLREIDWLSPTLRMAVLAGLGVFLALGLYNPAYYVFYKLVPGFGLFRVPARWLFLYAFGVAMLAGVAAGWAAGWAADWLRQGRAGRLARLALVAMVAVAVLELAAAARALPFSRPTAPEAFSALRTAPSHILAAQQQAPAPGRFVSMSDTLFDPGDLAEMQGILEPQLPHQAVYDYVVAVKAKEIIAPNLPLAWKLYAVDGYDGGLLPLARYVDLLHLFLPAEDVLQDGRLREGLARIPPSRLLSILGARYVITDKVYDVWIDDVFYDLAFDAVLGAGADAEAATEDVPRFRATGLGMVSYLEGAADLPDGAPVAEVRLTTETGEALAFTLQAGRDTAQGRYGAEVAHSQAPTGHAWPGEAEGSDYITRLEWEDPVQVTRVEVAARDLDGQIHIRGLALVDARDGSSVPLILSTEGRFRQVHSGDVKVYEVLDALPRAYIVHQTRVLDDQAAMAALAEPSFDPAQTATLAAGRALDESPPSVAAVATVTRYDPEAITIEASTSAPGYLVLSDAWYPGWKATVDGEPAAIERANVHFRALYLAPGKHTVRLVYRPASFYVGVGISAVCVVGLAAVWVGGTGSRRGRVGDV